MARESGRTNYERTHGFHGKGSVPFHAVRFISTTGDALRPGIPKTVRGRPPLTLADPLGNKLYLGEPEPKPVHAD